MVPPPRRPGRLAIRAPPRASGSADASRRPQAWSSPRGRPGPVCSQAGRADRRAGTRRSARPRGEEPGQRGRLARRGPSPEGARRPAPRGGARRAGGRPLPASGPRRRRNARPTQRARCPDLSEGAGGSGAREPSWEGAPTAARGGHGGAGVSERPWLRAPSVATAPRSLSSCDSSLDCCSLVTQLTWSLLGVVGRSPDGGKGPRCPRLSQSLCAQRVRDPHRESGRVQPAVTRLTRSARSLPPVTEPPWRSHTWGRFPSISRFRYPIVFVCLLCHKKKNTTDQELKQWKLISHTSEAGKSKVKVLARKGAHTEDKLLDLETKLS